MPVIKSAIKKLRRDKKREKENEQFTKLFDSAVRAAKKQKNAKTVSAAFSYVDRAVKKNLIHRGKGARLKSALSKLSKPATKTKVAEKVSTPKVVTAKSTPIKKAVSKKTPKTKK